ncbi:MAG TPA: hypothetical protein VGN16_17165 [Acidobacteriaceae bacterium]
MDRRNALRQFVWVLVAASATACLAWGQEPAVPHSEWVHPDRSGKLVYRRLKTGERILDFSYAGYMGGGVALPAFPVKATVTPSGADDTAAIQAAIDKVSNLPPVHGVRGAVLLKAGHFYCSATLKVTTSGVAVRGSGAGEDGTVIEMTGDPHLAFSIAGDGKITPVGIAVAVADAYVPAGAMTLSVRDASGFKSGDRVQIVHPVTPEWVRLMGMDALTRNGKKQTWVANDLKTDRTVVTVEGNTLRFDVPLADSYDAKFLGPRGATVVKVEETGEIEQVGVENLRLVAPARAETLNDKHFNGLQMSGAKDSWVRNLRILDTTEAIGIGKTSRRVTVEKVDATQNIPITGAAKPADFSANGTQILFDRCSATGDNVFYLAVGPGEQGPNVMLHCVFHGNGHVQPHQRWSTGLLIDSCQAPGGGIDLMNRGEMGSGHGWTMGWGVVWNNIAKSYVIQMPPGSANWSIGNRGEQALGKMPTFDPGPELQPLPQGIIESQGTPVAPASLYLEQLRQRLGAKALKNIGY